MGLETCSAAEVGRLVNGGEVSPVEVVDFFARRIQRRNPSLNAFVYTRMEEAIDAAKALEGRLSRGEGGGPFAGVPFGLKDFLPSKQGWPNSHGGVEAMIRIDPESSVFCTAMERAGGIAIGKTNAPAFAFRGTCDNYLYGPTSTPFAVGYNSGGSSGGSAAAVADGMVPIAEGSDGGGSIRIPAAWCGCYGFKPSVGTVPSVVRPDGWCATHPYCFNGGLTKTVEDSAILLSYMSGYDPRDPLSLNRPRRDFLREMNRPLKGWKIAYTPDFGVFPVEGEVLETVEQAAMAFREAGAEVVPVNLSLPYTLEELAEAWCRSICVDTAIEMELDRQKGFDLMGDYSHQLPRSFLYWNKKAMEGGLLDYYRFNTVRTALYDMQREIFERFDLLLSPTTACLPVPNAKDGNTHGPDSINGVKVEPLIGFCETFFFNFTGNPAASVPAGLSKSGLPIGMQLVARRFDDGDVLAASRTFEQLRPWRERYQIPLSRSI